VCVFVSRLTGRTAHSRRLHQQAVHRDGLTAGATIAECSGVEAPQRRLDLGEVVAVALLLRAAHVLELALRRFVLAVCDLVGRDWRSFALCQLGRVHFREQLLPSIVQKAAKRGQVSLGRNVHAVIRDRRVIEQCRESCKSGVEPDQAGDSVRAALSAWHREDLAFHARSISTMGGCDFT
jgi:hypothetical protein